MKVKLCDLKPNPFKKKINGGKLSEETIEKIMSNMDELGLMGALPVFKKDNSYYLIAGHHRVEAAKRRFGKDAEIEVILHNYNNEQVLRGMVVENLTQRSNEFREEKDNLLMIREYLSETCSLGEQVSEKGSRGPPASPGSTREIAAWLNKQGEVMSIGKITNILAIADNLSPKLQEIVDKQSHATGEKKEDTGLGIKDAIALARIKSVEEQEQLAEALKKSSEQHGNEKAKNLTIYKDAPEEIKQKVRDGEIDIAEIQDAILETQRKEHNGEIQEVKFIPNFDQRVKEFSHQVDNLTAQVSIFKKAFSSGTFKQRYSTLGKVQKENVDSFVGVMKKRIKCCYDTVEQFDNIIKSSNEIEDKR